MSKRQFNIFINGQIINPDLVNENFVKMIQHAIIGSDAGGASQNFNLGDPIDGEAIVENAYVLTGKEIILHNAVGAELGRIPWDDLIASAGGKSPLGYLYGGVPSSPTDVSSQYTAVAAPAYNSTNKYWTLNGSTQYVTFDLGDADLSAEDFVLNFRFRATGVFAGRYGLVGLDTADEEFIRIEVDPSELLVIYLSSNGTSWDIADAVTGTKADWAADQDYDIKLAREGAFYKLYWSDDGKNVGDPTKTWNEEISIGSISTLNNPTARTMTLGAQLYLTDRFLTGWIYANNTTLFADGKIILYDQGRDALDLDVSELSSRGIDDVTNVIKDATRIDTGSDFFVPYNAEAAISINSSYCTIIVHNSDDFDQYVIINTDALDQALWNILKIIRLKDDAITAINSFTARTLSDYKYMGSFLTDASANISFLSSTQSSGGKVTVEQYHVTDLSIVSGVGSSSYVALTLAVPPNKLARIKLASLAQRAGGQTTEFKIKDNILGNVLNYDIYNGGNYGNEMTDTILIRVDENSQIQYQFKGIGSSGGAQVYIKTQGWEEERI